MYHDGILARNKRAASRNARCVAERVAGRVEVTLRARVSSAEAAGGGVRLRIDGPRGVSELRVDHVVAATGFRIDVDHYLDPALAKSIAREIDGIPALDSRWETSVPGLFMVVGVATLPVTARVREGNRLDLRAGLL